jgi:hypothetical protein
MSVGFEGKIIYSCDGKKCHKSIEIKVDCIDIAEMEGEEEAREQGWYCNSFQDRNYCPDCKNKVFGRKSKK